MYAQSAHRRSAFYAIPPRPMAMPLRCCGDACVRSARTSVFCIFLGRRGITVRTPPWCDRGFRKSMSRVKQIIKGVICCSYMSRVVRKPDFCICENKDADQLRSNCAADQRLCFRYTDSTLSLYYLNPKFQASSHLLWLYSPVCVRPGRKPRRPVFSQRGSYSEPYGG